MYIYTFLAAMKYILSGYQNTWTSLQPFVTLSLLIKRNLQFFDRASPNLGFEPLIICLLDKHFSLLTVHEIDLNLQK